MDVMSDPKVRKITSFFEAFPKSQWDVLISSHNQFLSISFTLVCSWLRGTHQSISYNTELNIYMLVEIHSNIFYLFEDHIQMESLRILAQVHKRLLHPRFHRKSPLLLLHTHHSNHNRLYTSILFYNISEAKKDKKSKFSFSKVSSLIKNKTHFSTSVYSFTWQTR